MNKNIRYILIGLALLFVIQLIFNFNYLRCVATDGVKDVNKIKIDTNSDAANMNLRSAYLIINNKCFHLEIAETPEQRRTGLGFRASLPEDHGMLFVFDIEYQYGFWMKNTFIDLDIIWINKDGIIVDIAHMNSHKDQTTVYTPKKQALYVLELNSGTAKKNNIKIGDSIKIPKI